LLFFVVFLQEFQELIILYQKQEKLFLKQVKSDSFFKKEDMVIPTQ
jgi:hypothetical protein